MKTFEVKYLHQIPEFISKFGHEMKQIKTHQVIFNRENGELMRVVLVKSKFHNRNWTKWKLNPNVLYWVSICNYPSSRGYYLWKDKKKQTHVLLESFSLNAYKVHENGTTEEYPLSIEDLDEDIVFYKFSNPELSWGEAIQLAII